MELTHTITGAAEAPFSALLEILRISYKVKRSEGWTARGNEDCFAIPLARGEFASALFFNGAEYHLFTGKSSSSHNALTLTRKWSELTPKDKIIL